MNLKMVKIAKTPHTKMRGFSWRFLACSETRLYPSAESKGFSLVSDIIFLLFVACILASCAPQAEDSAGITISGPEENASPDENTQEVPDGTTTPAEMPENTSQAAGEEEPIPEEGEITGNGYEIIEIEDLKFKPKEITIDKGTTVKWIHNDLFAGSKEIKHIISVYKKGSMFNIRSPQLFFGDSFNCTFTEPGDYYYVSIVYASKGTRGDITVE